jgi:hypothetical protein
MFKPPCDIEQVHSSSSPACAVIVYFLTFQYDQVIAATRVSGYPATKVQRALREPRIERLF